ncbi:hypothetical protein EVAR_78547_1 [Eumeta japonica]|uniref:Mariner Mos1 transposase n=1 Tax=Eumeta variegata TaxID=151549 RepID=A0A4C1W9M3_EUMVA|nr:hypothetical protein EVAR_78547_1 [Eumeta japonica]
MNGKIHDVCGPMKDGRFDILCTNETEMKDNGGVVEHGSSDAYRSGFDQNQRARSGVVSFSQSVSLDNRKAVNSEWHVTIYLPEDFEEIRKNNRQRRIIIHHDNASCHTSAETIRFLEGQKMELTGLPPYRLDLTPTTFLFYLLP